MKIPTFVIAGLTLAACDTFSIPGVSGGGAPGVDPARQAQFVALVEGAGCELHQEENDALLDPAGFGDAEASAISRSLIAEGQAEVTSEGNLRLTTGTCL